MSSFVPSNNTFFTVLSFLNDYSAKTGYSLVGVDRIGAGPENVNTSFIERLLNLNIKSVAKQYNDHADTVEIYTPEFMPVEIKFVTAEACLKQLECISYQIESPELDYETYSQLQALQLHLVKEMSKASLNNNKAYQESPWGVA